MSIALKAVKAFVGSLLPVVLKKYPFKPLRAILTFFVVAALCYLNDYFGFATVENAINSALDLIKSSESH